MTITRFSSFFVKVICSLLILTFSRISYTLTISQNNNSLAISVLTIAPGGTIIYVKSNTTSAMMRRKRSGLFRPESGRSMLQPSPKSLYDAKVASELFP